MGKRLLRVVAFFIDGLGRVSAALLPSVCLCFACLSALPAEAATTTYTTDAVYTVPAGVTAITVTVNGGGGGGGGLYGGSSGGGGELIKATIPVTPGQQFQVYPGDGGGIGGFTMDSLEGVYWCANKWSGSGGLSSYGRGGNGSLGSNDSCMAGSGGGGGASALLDRTAGNKLLIVAGGGGGGSTNTGSGYGAWGRNGGLGPATSTNTNGLVGQICGFAADGGGGGGYVGGSGGDCSGNGAGGGSHYIDASATGVTDTPGGANNGSTGYWNAGGTGSITIVEVLGDPAQSGVYASVDRQPADGTSAVVLKAMIKNSSGNAASGEIVTFAATPGVNFGAGIGVETTCTTGSDGTCTVNARSTVAGQKSTEVKVGGSPLAGTFSPYLPSPVSYFFGTAHIYNVSIVDGGTDTNMGYDSATDTYIPTGQNAQIGKNNLSSKLNSGKNVTITTTGFGSDTSQAGDITVSSAISIGVSGSPALNLTADHSIAINADITAVTVSLPIHFTAKASGGGYVSGSGNIDTNGGLTTFDFGGSTTGDYSGVISGSGGVTKAGSGTMLLTGAENNYQGATTVNVGVLKLGVNSGLPTASAVTVDSGATLDLNGKSQSLSNGITSTSGTLALGTNGSLTLTGGVSAIGTNLTGSGTITVNTGATLELTGAIINPNATIKLNGGTLKLGNLTHTLGTLDLDAHSALDFNGTASQLTVTTLTMDAFTLNCSNWEQGSDRFYATTTVNPTPSGRDTPNLAPLNQITLGNGGDPAKTIWASDNEITVQSASAANSGVRVVTNNAEADNTATDKLEALIRNSSNAPVSGVEVSFAATADVEFCDSDGTSNCLAANTVKTCTTAANGTCQVTARSTVPKPDYSTAVTINSGTPLSGGSISIGEKTYTNSPAVYAFGRTLYGTVFEDNGAGGGTAHNSVKDGSEAGLGGVTVSLFNNDGGAAIATATTAADGSYSLSLVGVPLFSVVKVNATVPTGRLAISESAGTTGGTIGSQTDGEITNITIVLSSLTGADFGQVLQPALTPSTSAKVAQPGGTVYHPITVQAYTSGSVGITTSAASTPATGWTVALVEDTDCDGQIESNEGAVVAFPHDVSVGDPKLCLAARVTAPAGAPLGSSHQLTVTATMTYADRTVTSVRTMTATTTVGEGTIILHKAVSSETAQPGDTLTYTLTYTNPTAKAVSNVVVTDATPAYTTYVDPATLDPPVNAKCVTPLPAGISACEVTTQPDADDGWMGQIQWTLTGSLNSGASGTLEYKVKVDE